MELITVKIEKPAEINFVLGQTHFIKTVEDIHETLVAAVPGIRFGLAFCEASGKCLVRWSGTDPAMIKLAQGNAQAVAAGHSFFVFFGEGFYPINVLIPTTPLVTLSARCLRSCSRKASTVSTDSLGAIGQLHE